MMPLPCTVLKVETRKLVKAVDKEKEQEQYDLDLSSEETKNSKAILNDLFPIVHNICTVYNKMLHACVIRKSSYISEENGAILNVFFCCLHHRVVLWTTS